MNDPKYAYPYPAQGYYQGPPVMAPPQYTAPPPQRSQPGFLEGWPRGIQARMVRICGHRTIGRTITRTTG
ncbi:unnamed protein product [Camellia sinensis]